MKLTTEELAEMEAAVVACPPDWEETETGFDIRTTPDERGMSITVVHGEVSLDDLRDAIQEGDSLYTILSPAVRRLIANSRQWIPNLLDHIAEVETRDQKLRDACRRAEISIMETSGEWHLFDTSKRGKELDQQSLDIANKNCDLELENAALRDTLSRIAVEYPDAKKPCDCPSGSACPSCEITFLLEAMKKEDETCL